MEPNPWTRPDELLAVLRRRWARGDYLKAHARGDVWKPLVLPIQGPRADDLLRDPAKVVGWTEDMRRAAVDRRGRPRFVIEDRTVSSRLLGHNSLPARIRLDSLGQLAELLGTTPDIAQLEQLLEATRRVLPDAVEWVAGHPIDALAHREVWDHLLNTTAWILTNDTSSSDIRHLDVLGVDTKFVERHRKILGRLLDQTLPAGRIDPTASDFARRYGFRPRPRYVRLRLLAPVPTLPAEITEVELRADELARLPLPISTVFVIENKASYLAFPELPDAVAVLGNGFAVTTLELVPWLAERDLVYWGDIDTHGFVILNRLRQRVPSTRSILMDEATLLAHPTQWTDEPTPTDAALSHLTAEEAGVYSDLVEDRYGPTIRLEQERIRFAFLRSALQPWTEPTSRT
jgi:hypothetical protein